MRRRTIKQVAYLSGIALAAYGTSLATPRVVSAQDTMPDQSTIQDTMGSYAPMPDSMQLADSMPMSDSMVVDTPPPPIPTYAQPPVVQPGYVWMPGYWAWGPAGYFWVPGAWTLPPAPGLLWTPGYWHYSPVVLGFVWSRGYWGPRVGFYGGINYGFGYFGTGFVGGRWVGGRFFYNTAVTHVNMRFVNNVYVNRTVVVNNTHVSYNGGRGGLAAQPRPAELAVPRRQAMTAVQVQHERQASQNRNQLAWANHSRSQLSTDRTGTMRGRPGGFEPLRPQDRAMARTHARRMRGRPNRSR